MAINDKTMHPAIKRLSFTIQIMLIFLILIAVIEYFIIYKQIVDTKANFRLIELPIAVPRNYIRLQKNSRSMILMSQGILKNYAFMRRERSLQARSMLNLVPPLISYTR